MSLSILALVFCLSFASAVLEFTTIPANATIDYGVDWTGVQFVATDVDSFSIDDTTRFTINSTGFLDNKLTLPVGIYTINVTINDSLGNSTWTLYKLQVLALEAETCKYSDNGNLRIDIDDVSVEKGYGKDNDWFLLDGIEVKVEVENRGDEKIKDIEVEWGLYDRDTDYWIIKEKESDFTLKSGDEKLVTLTFSLSKVKKFKDSGDYVLYVWATGEDAEFNGEKTCVRDSENIDMIIEDDFVIIGDLSIVETAFCGGEVTISANVWNIGEDDQDEVVVLIYSKELGLADRVQIGDIDAFDSESLEFSFTVPKSLDEKTYAIKLIVYDDRGNIYENDYDDDQSISYAYLKVEGGCAVAEASVSAVLESGGQAGKQMVIKATITNTGDRTTTYSLNVAGYTDWASMAVLDTTLVTLESGKSQEVFVTFNVNKEISGEKLFVFEVVSENEIVLSQPVSVDITKRSGLFGITGNVLSGDNKYVWGIGILNLILIILIIIIALRITRK